MHITRYQMYKRIENHLLTNPIEGKILGISGMENFYPFIDRANAEITEVFYPEVNMQSLPFSDETFDCVISDQVIEHLTEPKQAIRESHRVLKGGGVAIHTTCFMNLIHPCPKDYWRFTPDALRYLCRDFSEIIQCEGWGNRLAHILLFTSNKLRFIRIPDSRLSIRHWLATWNEESYQIVTWIIARK